MQITYILKDLILRYTGGKSTSVTVETAEKLLNSIHYSMDAYISSIGNPDERMAALKGQSIGEVYDKGIKIVESCVAEAKTLYGEIKRKKLKVPLIAYNNTIDEALPTFFRKYEVVFDAHYTMADIDYPLTFDDMDIKGIFYIRQYLENLNIENSFCSLFSSDDIIKTLTFFGKIYGIDYEVSLINIFEVLINNSLFFCNVGG